MIPPLLDAPERADIPIVLQAWGQLKPFQTKPLALSHTCFSFPRAHSGNDVIPVGCTPSSALVFLPHLEAVLQHRQAALYEVAIQCRVTQTVAAFLLDQHRGNTRAACTAWDHTPNGNPVTWLCICHVASRLAPPPPPPPSLLCTSVTESKKCT